MKKALLFLVPYLVSYGAYAQSQQLEAKLPRTYESTVHLAPVAGMTAFSADTKLVDDSYGQGSAFGILGDVGSGSVSFQTGALGVIMNSQQPNRVGENEVRGLAVPLFAKWNFSGNPKSTVFAKAGAMPVNVYTGGNRWEVLAAAGIGGTMPLGRNSALMIDGTYNRALSARDDMPTQSGFALLGGLVVGL